MLAVIGEREPLGILLAAGLNIGVDLGAPNLLGGGHTVEASPQPVVSIGVAAYPHGGKFKTLLHLRRILAHDAVVEVRAGLRVAVTPDVRDW